MDIKTGGHCPVISWVEDGFECGLCGKTAIFVTVFPTVSRGDVSICTECLNAVIEEERNVQG